MLYEVLIGITISLYLGTGYGLAMIWWRHDDLPSGKLWWLLTWATLPAFLFFMAYLWAWDRWVPNWLRTKCRHLQHHCLEHPLAGIAYAFGFENLGDAIHDGAWPTTSKEESKKLTFSKTIWEQWLESAMLAWALPHDYFDRGIPAYGPRPPDVYIQLSCNEYGWTQSPLHRIMSGCHSMTPPESQERLWANKDYRRAVAHVLQHQSVEKVQAVASFYEGDGYLEPVRLTLLRAIKEGLVGLKGTWQEGGEFGGSWQYEEQEASQPTTV